MKTLPKIRTRNILVAIMLSLVMGVSLFSTNWLKQMEIAEGVKHELLEINMLFPKLIESEAMLMAGQIDLLLHNQNLKEAWLAKDRDRLLRMSKPIFKSINAQYRITHFYYINIDKTCFLRVHKPDFHNDVIKRHTLDQAAKYGNMSSGIELGPLGTFTLRFVHPWLIEGEIKGYIELGMGIEHISPVLTKILDAEMVLTIKKQYLNRAMWEDGLKAMGRTGDWDQFAEIVVIDKTIADLPESFISLLKNDYHNIFDKVSKVKFGDRNFRIGFSNLQDANGAYVGDMILLKDVTKPEMLWRMFLAIQLLVSFIFIMACFVFFYARRRGTHALDTDQAVDDLLQLLKAKEHLLKENDLRIEELQNELTHLENGSSGPLEIDKRKKQSEKLDLVLNSKQIGLFSILSQGEKNYEQIYEIAKTNNLEIHNIAALRLQINRLTKKLENETIFTIEKIRRDGVLYFRLSSSEDLDVNLRLYSYK